MEQERTRGVTIELDEEVCGDCAGDGSVLVQAGFVPCPFCEGSGVVPAGENVED